MSKKEIRNIEDLIACTYAHDLISHAAAAGLLYESGYEYETAWTLAESLRKKYFASTPPKTATNKITVGGRIWQQIYNAIHSHYMLAALNDEEANELLNFIEMDVADHAQTVHLWREERGKLAAKNQRIALPEPRQLHWREFLDTLRELYMNDEVDMDVVLACIDPEQTDSAVVCDLTGAWEAEKEELATLESRVRNDFGHWEEYMESPAQAGHDNDKPSKDQEL